MLTKAFKEMPLNFITRKSFRLTTCKGSTYTVTIPTTIDSGYQSYLSQYMMSIPGMMEGRNLLDSALNEKYTGGVCFGTGTATPTENDYTMTQKLLNSSTATVTASVTTNGSTITGTYTIVNVGSSSITITEVGLFGNCMYSKNQSYCYLVDRTLLDEPLTIEAGAVGKIVYTITIE